MLRLTDCIGPIFFSPVDQRSLYLGANVLFRTGNGGHSWTVISPDLSRPAPEVPASIGVYRTPELARQRKVAAESRDPYLVALAAGCFALAIGYTYACERL